MRKIICLFLAVLMTFTVCACNQSANDTVIADETTVDTSVKIGLICLHDENATYDKNFIDAFTSACEKENIEYIIKTNIPETNECYEAAADLVDSGCNLIFADSFGHESFILQAAQEFPDVQFCHATGTLAHTENLSNYHNAFASIYEGRFLAGIAAGLKLKEMMEADPSIEPKIGYVGAFTYAEVISGYTAWYLGVKRIVPDVTMQVQFTGSWYDESLEKEAAQTLINNGCVLISQHADSMGSPTACEEAGIPNISYNGSTITACSNTFIVSSRIDWQPYFEYIIECTKNRNSIATDWIGGIENGSVKLTDINEDVAAKGTAEEIKSWTSALNNKTEYVFDIDTFTVNGQKVESYLADVDSDSNYEGDTEVIKDGYFHESEYRSAPYFDLTIDGITVLNEMY